MRVLIAVIIVALALGVWQWRRESNLREEITRLESERVALVNPIGSGSSRSAGAVQATAPATTDAIGAVVTAANELRMYSRGHNAKWAALGKQVFSLSEEQIPAALDALLAPDRLVRRGWVWCFAHDVAPRSRWRSRK